VAIRARLATGLAAGCVAECLRHVADREAFRATNLGVFSRRSSFKLADMESRGPLGTARPGTTLRRGLSAGEPAKKQGGDRPSWLPRNAAMDKREGTPPRSSAAYGYMKRVPGGPVSNRDAKVCWRSAKATSEGAADDHRAGTRPQRRSA